MSGICAVWRKDGATAASEILSASVRGLALATSEHQSQAADPDVGVAVSARFDTQQVYRNSRVLIACDADLLNEAALQESVRDRQQTPGAAKTASLFAALYERYGGTFVEKLRGAFSVVLWDRVERKLFAAVDGFGMHRLVYSDTGKTLIVASRAHAVAASGVVDLEINPHAIPNLLNFSVNLAPETIFTQVRRIPPGCVLQAGPGNEPAVKPYWDMRYGVPGETNENRLSKELESLFERCVAEHCNNEPLAATGAFLSGGTDSSTVVGMMSRMGQGPVKAFSIGFQEQSFDELEYAKIAASKFQAQHFTYLVGAQDCFEALPDMVRYFDEPFGNSSAIPTYFCARLAAQNGVTTMLAGDGGDELFGGNERYATDKVYGVYQSVPSILRRGIIEPVLNATSTDSGLFGRAKRYVRRANMTGMDRLLSHQFLSTHNPTDIFEPDFLKALGAYSILDVPRHYYEVAPARDPLDRILYADVKITLGDSDLPKVTCMAELAGMKVRFPFLDRAVAEFSGRMPAHLKVKGFEKRYLFKKAFGNLLPIEIIKKKKHGFGIPVAVWLKSDPKLRSLCRDTLLSRRSLERGYFRRDFIDHLFREHEADGSSYYGDILWTFLVLELWCGQTINTPAGMTA